MRNINSDTVIPVMEEEERVHYVASAQCRSLCDNKDRRKQKWEENKRIKVQEGRNR
jgi:hypothetical protein